MTKKYMMHDPFFIYDLIFFFFCFIIILRTFIYVRKEKYIWLKTELYLENDRNFALDDYENNSSTMLLRQTI